MAMKVAGQITDASQSVSRSFNSKRRLVEQGVERGEDWGVKA
jgi:hypothetical protein